MRRFKSIFLYADRGSSTSAAFRQAQALAAENQALLHVIDVLPGSEEGRWTERSVLRSRQTEVTARLEELRRLVVPALRHGVAVQVGVLVGRPVVEITRAVLRNGHDLVVLNADAREGRPGESQARTALRLLRVCPCPVWVVKGEESGSHRRVLAAVDAGEDWSGDQKESLRVLELAEAVAESGASELRIVYFLAHWSSIFSGAAATSSPTRHDHRLDELLAKCDLSCVRCDVRLEPEPAVEVIAAVCKEVDVLVMGTVWRSGPVGLLIADAAKDALEGVDCSVLVATPEGLMVPERFGGRPSSRTVALPSRAA